MSCASVGVNGFYEESSACVRVAENLSFKRNNGLIQGCRVFSWMLNIYEDGGVRKV